MPLSAVHEERVFYNAGTLHDHLPDQMLTAPIIRRLQRRNVQHAEQLTLGIEHRRRRTGQPDEGRPKVITFMNRHRRLAREHGGNPAGPFLAFRPAGSQV